MIRPISSLRKLRLRSQRRCLPTRRVHQRCPSRVRHWARRVPLRLRLRILDRLLRAQRLARGFKGVVMVVVVIREHLHLDLEEGTRGLRIRMGPERLRTRELGLIRIKAVPVEGVEVVVEVEMVGVEAVILKPALGPILIVLWPQLPAMPLGL